MKSFLAFALIAGSACLAHASEPVLHWSITTFDSQGQQINTFRHSSHSMTWMQLRLICDPTRASHFPVETVSALVEVRPFANGGPPTGRVLRSAEITCDEIRSDSKALTKRIPVPRTPPANTQEIVNFWN
jgi:hypothetical protein